MGCLMRASISAPTTSPAKLPTTQSSGRACPCGKSYTLHPIPHAVLPTTDAQLLGAPAGRASVSVDAMLCFSLLASESSRQVRKQHLTSKEGRKHYLTSKQVHMTCYLLACFAASKEYLTSKSYWIPYLSTFRQLP